MGCDWANCFGGRGPCRDAKGRSWRVFSYRGKRSPESVLGFRKPLVGSESSRKGPIGGPMKKGNAWGDTGGGQVCRRNPVGNG